MSHGVEIRWAGRPVRIEHAFVGSADARAPLVVFLHEGLGSLAQWKGFPAALCDALGAGGLVYSRPGYGRSTPRAASEAWGVDFLHRQAFEVLPALFEALGIDGHARPLWLFGHSDGGSIALLHAARDGLSARPRIAGAVVLAPHILVEDVSVTSIEQARRDYLGTDLRERMAKYHDDPDSAFWGWNDVWLRPEFRDWSIAGEIATIRCPLLAVQGLDDEFGTLEQIRGIARRVPHCERLELAECRHSPQRDQPEALIAAVARFFAANARTAACAAGVPSGPP